MKRILSLLLIICMMTVMVVGCGDTQTETSDTTDTVETTTEATTTTEASSAETTTTETTTEETTTEETTTEATTTEQQKPEEPTVPKSLKILAIGNSFSDDATDTITTPQPKPTQREASAMRLLFTNGIISPFSR